MPSSHGSKAISLAGVFCVSVSLAACSGLLTKAPSAPHPRSTILSDLEPVSSLQLLYHCGSAPSEVPSGLWTPSRVQITEVDRRVRASLASSLSTTPHVGNSDDYYIQYLGLVMNGRKVILANGVHEVGARSYLPSRWRSTLMVICDLGRGGFRMEYDVKTRQWGEIRFAEAYGPTM